MFKLALAEKGHFSQNLKKAMCLSCIRHLVKVDIPSSQCEHFSQVELSKKP
jgi:hypothetical protein